jgi:GTP pyrophosphokinase
LKKFNYNDRAVANFPLRSKIEKYMNVKEIISLMESPTKEDVELITKAFNFSMEAHKNQTRYSGEPYFTHLFETAKNLADLKLDAHTISAGLLHDTIEDATVPEETILNEFGEDILFLINGVTKLGKLKYRGAERHVGSLRKLFVAMSQDIRVLIIKLTDRLHNMQTLEFVPKEKQKRIALETLEIYAPLAHRLSIWKLARELEDLAFPYTNPNEYSRVKSILRQKTHENEERLEKILNNIKKALAKENVTKFKTDYRVKGLYSFYKKLERKDWNADNIYDIWAIRIILPNESDCYRVLGIIHGNWRPLPGRIKDYIAFPKPNGYRSLHTTIFTGDGNIIEVQIRTEEMHKEAEYGIANHLSYKEGAGKKIQEENLRWFQKLFFPKVDQNTQPKEKKYFDKHNKPSAQKNGTSVPDWVHDLGLVEYSEENGTLLDDIKSDFAEYRVFVFTPQGDVIDLPVNSSPIDFAYAIHSDIGDHVFSAKVNGKLVSLDTPLQNGDIVEIATKESSKPTRKWLDFAKTTVAKRHIRQLLSIKE